MKKQRKALALISGGLDSLLAAKVIMEQGIHVEGVNFFTGFCGKRPSSCNSNDCDDDSVIGSAKHSAKQLGIKLHRLNVFEEYKKVVQNPRYGYGAHLNPCLDCRIFMVEQTANYMREHDFDFIITGEVIGQRPKSQLKQMLPVVEKRAGVEDLLLRPLCAKLLPPTLPEREGWVDREKLYAISGRSRKQQMELAKKFGFTEYAQPSGGCCFLINEHYCARLKDLWEARGHKNYTLPDLVLLKLGRHLRPRKHFKLIIGRDEMDNEFLRTYLTEEFATFEPQSCPGPLVLVDGELETEDDILLAARIVARYSNHKDDKHVKISYKNKGEERFVEVEPFAEGEILPEWIV